MSANDKVEACQYLLKRIRETKSDKQVNWIYLSAFLDCWRRSIDYLVLDFAQFYGITDYCSKVKMSTDYKTNLDEKIFEIAAKELENKAALQFLKWWKSKREYFRKNDLYSMIISPTAFSPPEISPEFKLAIWGKLKQYETNWSDLIIKFEAGLSEVQCAINEANVQFRLKPNQAGRHT